MRRDGYVMSRRVELLPIWLIFKVNVTGFYTARATATSPRSLRR